jgi:PTH1 family peptidyl-tRNA hydrolase
MWLVVGLGNPGDTYQNTRHNVGFMVVDALAARYSIKLKQKTTNFIFGRGFIEDHGAILVKPLTFMNRSGVAVMDVLLKFSEIEDLIIVYDDLDLETGMIRIRKKGSSGGHRGIQSVIDCLGSNDFMRLKIGIGRSARMSAERYVLKPFNRQQRRVVGEAVEKSVNAIAAILSNGLSYAQNRFHRE